MQPPIDSNVRGLAAQMIQSKRHALAKQVAAMIGPPPKSQKATTAQELKVWMQRGPAWANPLEDDANARLMYEQGFTPEDVLDAMYPQRRRLIRLGRPDIGEQVTYADRMAKLAEQEQLLMVQGGIAQAEQALGALDAGHLNDAIGSELVPSYGAAQAAA